MQEQQGSYHDLRKIWFDVCFCYYRLPRPTAIIISFAKMLKGENMQSQTTSRRRRQLAVLFRSRLSREGGEEREERGVVCGSVSSTRLLIDGPTRRDTGFHVMNLHSANCHCLQQEPFTFSLAAASWHDVWCIFHANYYQTLPLPSNPIERRWQ